MRFPSITTARRSTWPRTMLKSAVAGDPLSKAASHSAANADKCAPDRPSASISMTIHESDSCKEIVHRLRIYLTSSLISAQ